MPLQDKAYQEGVKKIMKESSLWLGTGYPPSQFQANFEQRALEMQPSMRSAKRMRKMFEEAAHGVSPGGKKIRVRIKSLFTEGPEGLRRANRWVLSSLKSAGVNVGRRGTTTGRGVGIGATALAKWFSAKSWKGKVLAIVGAYTVGRIGIGKITGEPGALSNAYKDFEWITSGLGTLAWDGEWNPRPYGGREEEEEEVGRPPTLEESMARAMQTMETDNPEGFMRTLLLMKEASHRQAFEEGQAQGQAGTERIMSDLQFARGFSDTEIPVGSLALEEVQRIHAGMPPSGALSPLAGLGGGQPSQEVPPEMYQQALAGGAPPSYMGG